MNPVQTLPATPTQWMPTTVGLPLTPAAILHEELRRTLQPASAAALEAIGQIIETDIVDPFLYATDPADSFVRLYPLYWRHHISASLFLAATFKADPQRLVAIAAHGLRETERTLRVRAPGWIGEDATSAASLGLYTVARIVSRLVEHVEEAPQPELQGFSDPERQRQWIHQFIAYTMAATALMAALRDASHLRGRRDNVRAAAFWSRGYAVKTYHLTKELGLLLLPAAKMRLTRELGLVPRSSLADMVHDASIPEATEDLTLADAGLDDWARSLREEDSRNARRPAG